MRRVVTGHMTTAESRLLYDSAAPNTRLRSGTAGLRHDPSSGASGDNARAAPGGIRDDAAPAVHPRTAAARRLDLPCGRVSRRRPPTIRQGHRGRRALLVRRNGVRPGASAAATRAAARPTLDRARDPTRSTSASSPTAAVTLVLDDRGGATLRPGDSVILRGNSHAWSNRSDSPDRAMSQHAAAPSATTPPSAPATGERPTARVRPIRRVVAGDDAARRSAVLYDSAVPNDFPRPTGTCFDELWTFDHVPTGACRSRPMPVQPGAPFMHSPPQHGSVWRIVDSRRSAHRQVAAADVAGASSTPMGSPGGIQRVERRARIQHAPHAARSTSATCLEGERHLVLETPTWCISTEGDAVIQRGTWHVWDNRSGVPVLIELCHASAGEFAA